MGNLKRSTSRNIAIQHNRLINSRHTLTLAEQKLFLAMVAQIQPDDRDFETYRIDIHDFVELTGTKHKGVHEQAQKITENLLTKVVKINLPNGDVLQTHFLGHAKYKNGKGYVEVSFYPELRPYLLELKKNFTGYDIRNILPLSSKYAIRIYELLKQFRTVGERRIFVDELIALLAIPESYSYGRLKKYILIPAQKSLEKHTDLYFSFEEIKQNRKVMQLKFTIHKQDMNLHDRPKPRMEVITSEAQKDVQAQDVKNPNPLHDVLEETIKKQYNSTTFVAWFEDTELVYEGDDLVLYCKSEFHKEWIEEKHKKDLQDMFMPTGRVLFKVNKLLARTD